MAVNFTKNQQEITQAWRAVVDSKDSQKWALFGYEGNTNTIKLTSTGSNGLQELVREFNNSVIQYAFCRVIQDQIGINKLILINWQGDSSPLSRKGLCASHVGDVANYFKGCAQTITIRNDDEATVEYLMEQIAKTSHSRIRSMSSLSNNSTSNSITTTQSETSSNRDTIGTTYKKVDIGADIASDRKSFWKRQEEEEKERLLEERKRAAEKQAQFDRERKLGQELEAKKLAETTRERDRMIEATRKAERHDSLGSQPSSNSSSNAISNSENNNDDDDRVGRRSELIRLERNQETHSLISKGLIKNKRAIFEQAASQQQSQTPPVQSNLTRRASGAMITQRMNSLKSFENVTSSSSLSNSNANTDTSKNVEKLTNGFADQVKINNNPNSQSVGGVVKSKVETIKVTNNDVEQPKSTVVTENLETNKEEKVKETFSQKSQEPKAFEGNGDAVDNNNLEKSNFETSKSKISNNSIEDEKGSEIATNGSNQISSSNNSQMGFKARALFDYQAADNTEISFDPEDLIAFIEKVDPGWWHGTVVSGAFKGQTGLFPSNYVKEL